METTEKHGKAHNDNFDQHMSTCSLGKIHNYNDPPEGNGCFIDLNFSMDISSRGLQIFLLLALEIYQFS